MKINKVYLLGVLLILIAPTIVLAKGNLAIECPNIVYENKETICKLYYETETEETISGLTFNINGVNSTIKDINYSSSFSIFGENPQEHMVLTATMNKLSGNIEIISFKLIPQKNAKIEISDISISVNKIGSDNDDDNNVDKVIQDYSYPVTLTKEENNNSSSSENKSDIISSIKDITIVNNKITPSFNPNIFEYTLTTSQDEIDINAIIDNDDIKISGTGLRKLEVGSNIIEIIATDKNGEQRTYKINVTREGNVKEQSNIVNAKTGINSALGLIMLALALITTSFIVNKKYKFFRKI